MSEFDFVIVGAGAAGEAAAHEARRRGASVVIIDRELFGGSCPFWACIPSKALLHAASVHAHGGSYEWPPASDFRDYMINRVKLDWPDDSGHVKRLEDAGAEVIRGEATIIGPGKVRVALNEGGSPGGTRQISGRNLVVAVGSSSTVPDLPGLDRAKPWTNREATSTRTLPRSLAILGGGPTGLEMAQVFARYGVPVTLVQSPKRLNDRDHPRSSDAIADGLRADGVVLRLGVRAESVEPRADKDGAHVVKLADGTTVEGHELMLSIGRTLPLDGLGLDSIGADIVKGRVSPDEMMRIAPNTYVVGDPAGPEMHTHLAHYQGETAVAIALGDVVRPDYRAIPRCVYTDPETGSVGLLLDQAIEQGIDAVELTVDMADTVKGQAFEAAGHISIVVDRAARELVGAFIAGPGASEAIHMAVLAIKTRTKLEVLAQTITAFPTTARAMGGLFTEAARQLER